MTRNIIVIGAGFGDEGKGHMVDYFASLYPRAINVRFNGGAQAGHTVCTDSLSQFIFGHLGAGTLAGLPTYLDKHFIVNPMLFRKEWDKLLTLGFILPPKVTIHPDCIITTPYDMMINQFIENHRGKKNNRHGSCGVGIYQTLQRNYELDGFFKFCFYDLNSNRTKMARIIKAISRYYYPVLMVENDITLNEEQIEFYTSDTVLLNYLNDIDFLLQHSQSGSHEDTGNHHDDVIWEGAQGLLLDQNNLKFWPHLTPSHTGLSYDMDQIIDDENEQHPVEIVYTTRCYLTRHGIGPLPYEQDISDYVNVNDSTNIENEWQGKLRFAPLNLPLLKEAILNDLQYIKGKRHTISLAITCLDQLTGGNVKFIDGIGVLNVCSKSELFDILKRNTGASKLYLSYGPNRKSILDFP